MKPALVTLFLVAILSGHVMVTSAADWRRFANCLRAKMGWTAIFKPRVVCAAVQMAWAYTRMNGYRCPNCDKYFHCKANYNAVRRCGYSWDARRAAEVISDCREFSQGGMDADGRADDIANRYGRNGGNCERQYLCRVNCKFNPRYGTCKPDNCR